MRQQRRDYERYSPQAVRADRERLGMSGESYAELLGVSMITVYAWEHGRVEPRPAQLRRWLEVRQMSQEEAWDAIGLEEVDADGRFSAKAVRAERGRLGMTAEQYGELVGVRKLSIYNWEKGRVSPRSKQLEAWLAVEGISTKAAWRRVGKG